MKRSVAAYWALLLIPTCVIVGVAFTLLSHEQDRINQAAVAAHRDRASAMAEAIHLTVEAVEENLTRALLSIKQEKLEETLMSWEESNPLIRNVFIWKKDLGLLYPSSTTGFNTEESRFKGRYSTLFSGNVKWEEPSGNGMTETAIRRPEERGSPLRGVGDNRYRGRDKQGERQQLVELSKAVHVASVAREEKEAEPGMTGNFKEKSGWIPWFAENRLFLLGWVAAREDGPVYGVELELMTLISRLIIALPDMSVAGTAYALVDGSGQLLHQTGNFHVDVHEKPDFSLAVSSLLPHWQIHCYQSEDAIKGGKGFYVVSIMVLFIFVAAIITGGILLTRQAQRDRKDAMEKTSFVSSVSHELKTPLTSIRMYAELLQAGRITTPERVNDYLEVIVGESRRLTRLVNNVLDFSRLEQHKKKYHLELLNFDDLVMEVVAGQSLRLKDAGIEPKITFSNRPLQVLADRDGLEQVLLNILDNAMKYAAEGGFLSISLSESCSGIEAWICDRGPGIPRKHRKKIFEKFHRVDSSLTAQQPGSGLGLSIAGRIMQDLGGDLEYLPADDKGSCFVIRMNYHE